jgi:cytochrome c oxidase subunit I
MSTVTLTRPAAPLRTFISTDHKRIAAVGTAAALIFFVMGGCLALLMRVDLANAGGVISQHTYDEAFTEHGSTMIFLFVVPIAYTVGLYLVPLQVGASNIAGARWALAGLWMYLIGGALIWSGFLTTTGAAQGSWWAFEPLSDNVYTPGTGMELWIFGTMLATAGQTMWAWNMLITALRRRAAGMTLMRMAPFTWTMIATSLMTAFSFPVFVVTLGLVWAQRHFGGVFVGDSGAVNYQNLFWFYGHPVVYVMFFPFTGMVFEILSTFSGRRTFGYPAFVLAVMAFAGLSMTVWGHHMFTMFQNPNKYFALTSTMLIVPAGIEYFDLLGTLWRGKIRYTTAFLFAVTWLPQFLIGGLTGEIVASPTLDYHLNMSYFVVGHFHYTIFAGSAFGLFGGIYYWFPKVTGARLREGLGKIHYVLMLVGTNLTFFPMLALGQEGMTRRIAAYPLSTGWQPLNELETAGAFLIASSVLLFIVNVAISLRRREVVGADPWEGHTLEWATPSPPPPHNFLELPPIRSFNPLLDLREARKERAETEVAAV